MKRINRNGFSKIEFMGILGLLAVLIAIGAKMAVDTGNNYKGFRILVQSFLENVAIYKDKYTHLNEDNTKYYLYELIEKGYSTDLTNPMDASQTCDRYETYADIAVPNDKTVEMLCGNYLVKGSQQKGYQVYEISEWSEAKKEGYTEASALYNYKDENGNLVFPEFYPESTFKEKYFEKNKSKIGSIYDLKEKLEMKTVYRKKTLVKDLK